MHFLIISGATRPQPKSNTAKILSVFCEGITDAGGDFETYYLSDRKQWNTARSAFAKNDHILFALPLYVENIPGSMLEFLSTIVPKTVVGTKISFLIQGGFPEPAQSRCCEAFCKTLPEKLGCEYAGSIVKGDMFGVGLMPEKMTAQMTEPFRGMGKNYGEKGYFSKEEADNFAGDELLSEKTIKQFNHIGRHMQKFFMKRIAKQLGCKEKLDAQPYL